VSHEARARRRELLMRSAALLHDRQHAVLLANVHESIAETYVSITVHLGDDLPAAGSSADRGLGCVESYPSLHADTFVLPSSDKRMDALLALEHLSRACTTLQVCKKIGKKEKKRAQQNTEKRT